VGGGGGVGGVVWGGGCLGVGGEKGVVVRNIPALRTKKRSRKKREKRIKKKHKQKKGLVEGSRLSHIAAIGRM